METALIEELGDELYTAWAERRMVEPLSARHP
ncbi:2-oxopent-4-enoate hydratase, partial [Castellaniella defragrans]